MGLFLKKGLTVIDPAQYQYASTGSSFYSKKRDCFEFEQSCYSDSQSPSLCSSGSVSPNISLSSSIASSVMSKKKNTNSNKKDKTGKNFTYYSAF